MISLRFRFLFVLIFILCTTSFAFAINYEDAKKKAENGHLASQIELADFFYTDPLSKNYEPSLC